MRLPQRLHEDVRPAAKSLFLVIVATGPLTIFSRNFSFLELFFSVNCYVTPRGSFSRASPFVKRSQVHHADPYAATSYLNRVQ